MLVATNVKMSGSESEQQHKHFLHKTRIKGKEMYKKGGGTCKAVFC